MKINRMSLTKPLKREVLAYFAIAGLGACVSTPPQSLPPKVEFSQQMDVQKSDQVHQLPPEQTVGGKDDVLTEEPELTGPLAEQANQPESCGKRTSKTKQSLLAESSDCYQVKTGAKNQGRGMGRCEPQSLPYARCRSGINSCNLGSENGPLTWFSCEKKAGNTSPDPKSGSVLILGSIGKHNMKTGHVMFVESVSPLTSSSSKLILSHTNYDRRCSKETKIEAVYNRPAMTLDIRTGAWKGWGSDLKVAGFILR